jgi:hypothetical protein
LKVVLVGEVAGMRDDRSGGARRPGRVWVWSEAGVGVGRQARRLLVLGSLSLCLPLGHCFGLSSVAPLGAAQRATGALAMRPLPATVSAHRGRAGALSVVCMSKADKRYKLAKRGANEDETLLVVAEQFRRREGQAQISWYPGHIAKAEKKLQEVLSAVDVVVEVRDARIPTSTTHPSVDEWLRNRNIQRVVCISREDMAPRSAMSMWRAFLESQDVPVAFMNCKSGGRGLDDLKKIIKGQSKKLNDRRAERGMLPRNVRVAVMGYPNVGKSALLNRLAGVKKVKSENKAGMRLTCVFVCVRLSLSLTHSLSVCVCVQCFISSVIAG